MIQIIPEIISLIEIKFIHNLELNKTQRFDHFGDYKSIIQIIPKF